MDQIGVLSLPLRNTEQLDLGASPYTQDFCSNVENRRQGFPGQQLFLDRLFSIGSIDPSEPSVLVSWNALLLVPAEIWIET